MTTIEKLLEQKNACYKKIEQTKDEIKEIGKSIFKVGSEEIFNKYPKLECISWEQYTSYFCDGDPCEFYSRHNDYYYVNGISGDGYNYQTKDEEGDYDFNIEEFEILTEDIDSFMENFNDEDMELLFGDHVKVTITRSGVDVESYTDHD